MLTIWFRCKIFWRQAKELCCASYSYNRKSRKICFCNDCFATETFEKQKPMTKTKFAQNKYMSCWMRRGPKTAVLESSDFISSHFLLSYFVWWSKVNMTGGGLVLRPNKGGERRRKGSLVLLCGNLDLVLLGNSPFFVFRHSASPGKIQLCWRVGTY